jgi:predicted DsbA family dithiol-disulfide isomerase
VSARVSVDFFADLSCPWCYVGWESLKRAAALRANTSISVSWRTFMLNPDTPKEGVDRKSYLAKVMDPARLAAAQTTLEAMAAAADAPIALDAATRIPNTIDAHRVVHWAAGYSVAESVIDALFRAYFVDGRDIGQVEELIAIGESCGLDPGELRERLAGDLDRALVLGFHAAAAKLGISGVPVAVFNRKAALMGAESVENYGKALDAA